MYGSQAPYREVHDALLEYSGSEAYGDVLVPWLRANKDECHWLKEFSSRSESFPAEATPEELCRLYALSRVIETLLLRFQQGRCDSSDWPGPAISMDEYEAFSTALGLTICRPSTYSPFHHEVVKVTPSASSDDRVNVLSQEWPCLMLGALLISRAGVHVSSNVTRLSPGIADSSVLYWAYRRKNRSCQDLSRGWGSNSQWRTRFRRDYRFGTTLHLNVDGHVDLSTCETLVDDGLSRAERIELLVNRCFVSTANHSEDWWPYDDTLRIQEQDV
jgi:hypothetical protein